MKAKLIVFIITFLFLAVQMVEAKPNVLLRLNLEKGANYEMTMLLDNHIDQEMMGQKMKILQKMEMVTSYKVLDVLPDKNYLIEYSFKSEKSTKDVNGQQTIIDTENEDSPLSQKLKNEINAFKVRITMDPQGKVQKVEGFEEFISKFSETPQLNQSMTMEMLSNENNFKAFFEQTFAFFPENEVEVGSKWTNSYKMPSMMNMDVVMNYEVADILDEQVVLNVLSDINTDSPVENNGMKMNLKMTGTQTGTMRIDRHGGLAGTSDLKRKLDILMKMKNPQSGEDMEIPMLMNSVIKISVVKV